MLLGFLMIAARAIPALNRKGKVAERVQKFLDGASKCRPGLFVSRGQLTRFT